MEKIRKKQNLFYAVMFVVLFFLCWLFPYSGDDWAWGSQIGLDRLDTWFDNYSGRYFGNLIVLALTRSNLLKTVVMSLCIGGIIILVNEITNRQKCGFGLIALILVFMPVMLLRQAVVWTAGFSNYTTSIFLSLIYIYYVKDIYYKKPKNQILPIIPLLLLGCANALIVENMTIYNVVLGVYVLVFTLVKYKRVYIQHISYLIGTVVGTVIMFSNSVYSSVTSGNDGYRTIAKGAGIISRALDSYLTVIMREGFLNNYILLCCLTAICLTVWFSIKAKISNKSRIVGYLSLFVMIGYTALSVMNRISCIEAAQIMVYLEGIATAFYIVAIIAYVFILPFEMVEKVKLLFILGSIGCMIAPLLVVTPIGSRCFFAPYVMFIYFAIELYSHFDDVSKERFANYSKVLAVIVAVGTLFLFYIYGTIYKNQNERVEKAQVDAKNGKTVVEVQELPYKYYVWCSDVYEETWETRFKLFYDIDQNVKLKMIPHK